MFYFNCGRNVKKRQKPWGINNKMQQKQQKSEEMRPGKPPPPPPLVFFWLHLEGMRHTGGPGDHLGVLLHPRLSLVLHIIEFPRILANCKRWFRSRLIKSPKYTSAGSGNLETFNFLVQLGTRSGLSFELGGGGGVSPPPLLLILMKRCSEPPPSLSI